MRVVAKKINNEFSGVTQGKVYKVISHNKKRFNITNDYGCLINTAFKNSVTIEGNWTIIGNPAVVEDKTKSSIDEAIAVIDGSKAFRWNEGKSSKWVKVYTSEDGK